MDVTKKIFAWILLLVGLVIIFYSFYSSYNIFTHKNPAPEIFSVVAEKTTVPSQIQDIVKEQLKNILPQESIIGLLNLISWSIFATILIFGGSQISSLGIKLMR